MKLIFMPYFNDFVYIFQLDQRGLQSRVD